MSNQNQWPSIDLAILKRWYPCESNDDVAKRLNRPLSEVKYMAEKLRLKKSKKYKVSVGKRCGTFGRDKQDKLNVLAASADERRDIFSGTLYITKNVMTHIGK